MREGLISATLAALAVLSACGGSTGPGIARAAAPLAPVPDASAPILVPPPAAG